MRRAWQPAPNAILTYVSYKPDFLPRVRLFFYSFKNRIMDYPNYYGILPAAVRYAKIADRAKVLYTEITALANNWGYCTASNSYFAELYECSPQAISQHIQNLEAAGFISCVLIFDEKQVKERRIYPAAMLAKAEQIAGGYQATLEGGIKPHLRGYQATLEDNNTSNNTKPISKDIGTKKSEIEILNLEETRAKFRESFPDADVDMEIEKAIDYIRAHGKRLKDYVAFMRNWMRNAHKYQPKNNNNGQRKQNGVISQSDFAEVVAALQQR